MLSLETYPLLRLTWDRLHEYAFYSPCISCGYESRFHVYIRSSRCFGRVDVIINLNLCDVLFGNKLSIIRLHLFCFADCFFFWRVKMTNTSSSFLKCLYITKKERNVKKFEASIFKRKYIATGKLEMGKAFAFSLFQHLLLVLRQTENWNGKREFKDSLRFARDSMTG